MTRNPSIPLMALVLGGFLAVSPAYALDEVTFEQVSSVLVSEGDSALAEGDLPAALQLYEQAVVSNPQNIDAYVGLGSLYFDAEIFPTSRKYFDIALSLNPTDLKTLELQAYTFLSLDDVDNARGNLSKMEQICFDRACDETDRVAQAIKGHSDVEEIIE